MSDPIRFRTQLRGLEARVDALEAAQSSRPFPGGATGNAYVWLMETEPEKPTTVDNAPATDQQLPPQHSAHSMLPRGGYTLTRSIDFDQSPIASDPSPPMTQESTETERERNGRLVYEARAAVTPVSTWWSPWHLLDEKSREYNRLTAEQFLAQVRPASDYGVLREWLVDKRKKAHEGARLYNDAPQSLFHWWDGCLFAYATVLSWLDKQEAGHE